MIPDDTYRDRLAATIGALSDWAQSVKDAAHVDITNSDAFWKLRVEPRAPGACPFELLFDGHQQFSLALADEIYENRPVDRFDFFLMLVRAIERGGVERIESRNALTDALAAIEMKVELGDGWAWVGERRVGSRAALKSDGGKVHRTARFLPYRR